MDQIEKLNIRNWIENLPKEGKITFTFEEVTKTFSSINFKQIIIIISNKRQQMAFSV